MPDTKAEDLVELVEEEAQAKLAIVEGLGKMDKDLRKAANELGAEQAQFLVKRYYSKQEDRKRAANRLRSLKDDEPSDFLKWMLDVDQSLEKSIKYALGKFAKKTKPGRWCLSVYGIGDVLTAGLMAYLDIHKAPTPMSFWRFCGLDPTQEWDKGQKRPWCAEAKTLCWKIGESFFKFHKRDACFYGPLFKARWDYEIRMNESGQYADQAAEILEKKNFKKSTAAYKCYNRGLLPPAHIISRAKRWTTKLFLSHLHQVMWESTFESDAPEAWVLVPEPTGGGHTGKIDPPNWPME